MKTITIDGVEYNLLPKVGFKAGDWVVIDNCNKSTYQVDSVREYDYMLKHTHGGLMSFPFSSAERLRLWTIEDAKDGDVLAADECYVIFKEIDGLNIKCYCTYHYMGFNPSFYIDTLQNKTAFKPANKEQREVLFDKMKGAGYQWDADKKELRKIQPHYDISNFQPFDKVLVRDADDGKWMATFYSHYMYEEKDYPYQFATIGTDVYEQCIPFEGNEHLLGTTDMCDEQYINW